MPDAVPSGHRPRPHRISYFDGSLTIFRVPFQETSLQRSRVIGTVTIPVGCNLFFWFVTGFETFARGCQSTSRLTVTWQLLRWLQCDFISLADLGSDGECVNCVGISSTFFSLTVRSFLLGVGLFVSTALVTSFVHLVFHELRYHLHQSVFPYCRLDGSVHNWSDSASLWRLSTTSILDRLSWTSSASASLTRWIATLATASTEVYPTWMRPTLVSSSVLVFYYVTVLPVAFLVSWTTLTFMLYCLQPHPMKLQSHQDVPSFLLALSSLPYPRILHSARHSRLSFLRSFGSESLCPIIAVWNDVFMSPSCVW